MMITATLLCIAIAITDGDTLKARCDNQTVTVRLTEIDAPEKKQPYGQVSKQSLTQLCLQKPTELQTQGKDKYGRTLAVVVCNGVNANREQVRRGLAWMYDQYATQQSWYADQDAAHKAKRGLWADARPIAPWVWRHSKRNSQS